MKRLWQAENQIINILKEAETAADNHQIISTIRQKHTSPYKKQSSLKVDSQN
ncbi:MAG: hypothetical protein K8R40_03900 [Anaerolineaceae bacterium]|nr:hypothetical protein [Anaerolineaceae bacterium]